MAINLFSLDKPEATLITVSYRLNTDKIKENWGQMKNESKNLRQIGAEAV